MAMHQGLDLSRFKRIATDEKTSTLRHSKGHEIKIAHSGLSDKMRDHLNAMPIHAADGADIKNIEDETPDPPTDEGNPIRNWISKGIEKLTSPPIVDEQNVDKVPEQLPEQKPEELLAEQTPQEVPSAPAPIVAQAEAPVVQPEQPQAEQQAQQPQAPPPEAAVSPEAKLDDHIKFAQDVASGQISPKTYNQLFAEKSTLGKIGTIFGMILAGAGSGLAHQPNMLMDMMNKEIDRDLEKQKQNIDNARSFLSTQYQHNLQKAQIAEHQQHVLASQVETAPRAAGAAENLKDLKAPGSDVFMKNYLRKSEEIWAPFEAKANMIPAVVDHLEKASANNPRAQQVLNSQIKPMAQKLVQKTLADGHKAVQDAAAKSKAAGHDQNVRAPVVNEDALGNAIRKGQYTPQGMAYQKGAINPSDVPAIQKEKGDLLNNRNGALDWNDSYNELANMALAGQAPGVSSGISGIGGGLGAYLSGGLGMGIGTTAGHVVGKITQSAFERERNIQKEALKQRIGKNLSSEDREAMVESMLPAWNDSPASLKEAHRKGIQHFQSQEVTPVLDTYNRQIPGLKSPFPSLELKEEKKKESGKDKKHK